MKTKQKERGNRYGDLIIDLPSDYMRERITARPHTSPISPLTKLLYFLLGVLIVLGMYAIRNW